MSEPVHVFKMNLNKKGLLMFFKPWQLICLKTLWKNVEGLSSREVWKPLGNEISRASVINFLELMNHNGILEKNEITGKGGYRGIYTILVNKGKVQSWVLDILEHGIYEKRFGYS